MGRTILIAGACAAGKSTLLTMGARSWASHFGRSAAIDTDIIVAMVDPNWELPENERALELAGHQIQMLAESFLRSGFDTVLIGGNGMHLRPAVESLIQQLRPLGEVHHVTIDPALEVVQARMAARGTSLSTSWVEANVEEVRRSTRGWTVRIDTSDLTPDQTLGEISNRTMSEA